ncbi:single-stranded-DNA-specific exonuclease RecJ [Cytobacillus gottheilii]|uniref:single-stranded-DNA-specific exonuclease RecJ n=1 Tax=Cytobacillus gottheilii TaxID=859144 RepID=UPI0009BBE755|nr:single-stranded-DNA-specific exonuclease RecJ [Cytobacillus gottheilii]
MLKSKTRWVIRQSEQEKVDILVKELKVTPLVASLLVNRGIDTVESARYFLFEKEQGFHDPFLLKGMDLAVARIKEAIAKEEQILIFGDYDADGVTSTTVMMTVLRDLGARVEYYIPNRFTEGYGPNVPAFEYAADIGVKLIITVDTGIAAINEAKAAKDLGLDLIITDHHEPGPELPEALAIIHPKLEDSVYPFQDLAGVGVALKVAHALYGDLPEHLLEIAAIGTIADLVPLKGENRTIAKIGIKKLRATKFIGLQELLKRGNIEAAGIDEETIGFFIGPRLNAAGRLDSADPAVALLLTEDRVEAEAIAEEIDNMNKERQNIVNEIAQQAIEEVETNYSIDEHPVIVVGKEGWNAGVIGIVASKLVEKFYRPAIVLSYDPVKGLAKGSARSIAGFDLFKNLSECRDILPHFGGHPMAAGMTLNTSDVDELRERLKELADQQLTEDDFVPVTTLDQRVHLAEIDLASIQELNMLAPFGMGNPKPKVVIEKAGIKSIRKIGANQNHLKVTLENDDAHLDGIGFSLGHLYDHISPDASINVIGELSINEWNNIKKPQIFIHDVAVEGWQLFDIRGIKNPAKLPVGLKQTAIKWIVFNEENVESIKQFANGPIAFISTLEEALKTSLSEDPIILADLPPSKALLSGLLQGKQPGRIYTLFYKQDSDFFSTMPNRDHFKWFYAFLAKKGPFDLKKHGNDLAKHKGWSRDSIDFISTVFFELDFVTIKSGVISLQNTANKRDLADSQTYRQKQASYELESDLLYSSYSQLKSWFDEVISGSVESEEEMGKNGLETIHYNR